MQVPTRPCLITRAAGSQAPRSRLGSGPGAAGAHGAAPSTAHAPPAPTKAPLAVPAVPRAPGGAAAGWLCADCLFARLARATPRGPRAARALSREPRAMPALAARAAGIRRPGPAHGRRGASAPLDG